MWSSIATYRLVIGVSLGYARGGRAGARLAAPASSTGRSSCVCWLPSPVRCRRPPSVVEQRAVAIRRGFQLVQEIRELLHVEAVDLRHLLDPLRVVAVVRQRMVRFGHADLAIRARAAFAAIMKVEMRVRSAWNASAIRSNISLHVIGEVDRNAGGLFDARA